RRDMRRVHIDMLVASDQVSSRNIRGSAAAGAGIPGNAVFQGIFRHLFRKFWPIRGNGQAT
ncbi:MAG TPA: hypothetical protein VNQ14_15195, partial [Woeseiaceae bacterium]|nr:hypothetical protein [Woeseiaceae bacterium]